MSTKWIATQHGIYLYFSFFLSFFIFSSISTDSYWFVFISKSRWLFSCCWNIHQNPKQFGFILISNFYTRSYFIVVVNGNFKPPWYWWRRSETCCWHHAKQYSNWFSLSTAHFKYSIQHFRQFKNLNSSIVVSEQKERNISLML
jgi:hypothetical protein